MGHAAPGLDRLDLDHVVGERRDLGHRGVDRAHPQVGPRRQLAPRHAQHPAQGIERELLGRAPAQVAALLDHLVERQRILGRQGEHHLALQAGKDGGVRDDLAQARRDFVFQQTVGAGRLDVPAQQLHAFDGGLAVPHDLDPDDGGHQAFDGFAHPVVRIVRAAQLGFRDDMQDRLVDGIPGVLEQLVVDAPVGQGQRRDLDQVHQLAGFDQRLLAWSRVDRAVG